MEVPLEAVAEEGEGEGAEGITTQTSQRWEWITQLSQRKHSVRLTYSSLLDSDDPLTPPPSQASPRHPPSPLQSCLATSARQDPHHRTSHPTSPQVRVDSTLRTGVGADEAEATSPHAGRTPHVVVGEAEAAEAAARLTAPSPLPTLPVAGEAPAASVSAESEAAAVRWAAVALAPASPPSPLPDEAGVAAEASKTSSGWKADTARCSCPSSLCLPRSSASA